MMVTTRVGLAQDQPNRPLNSVPEMILKDSSSRMSGGETDDKIFEK